MTNQDLFTIKRNDKVGRYAVASRALKPGDVIFTESPFAYGPKSGKLISVTLKQLLTDEKHS